MSRWIRLHGAALAVALLALVSTTRPSAEGLGVTTENWGALSAAVFGTSQSGAYAGAELFAGPNQFDRDYFHGVLPNGRIVRPAGTAFRSV